MCKNADALLISNLRKTHKIHVFKDFYEKINHHILSLKHFERALFTNNPEAQIIIFNPLKPEGNSLLEHEFSYRDASAFDFTFLIMVDIDQKDELQVQRFNDDYLFKCDNNYIDLLIRFKKDPYVLASGQSRSGKGIRAFFGVISYDSINNVCATPEELSLIHRNHFNMVVKYLTDNYGLKTYSSNSYIDTSAGKITQGTSRCLKNEHSYFNYHFQPLIIKEPMEIEKHLERIKSKREKNVDGATHKLNQEYFNKILHLIDKNRKTNLLKVIDYFKPILSHRDDYSVITAIACLDDRGLNFFYQLFKKAYQGKSMKKHLSSFDKFKRYMESQLKKDNYAAPIMKQWFYELKTLLVVDSDILGNNYNVSIRYDNYICNRNGVSDQELILANILHSNSKVLIKAPAGSGKTTFIIKYINQFTLDHPDQTIVFCAPKKLILNQVYEKQPNYNRMYNGYAEFGNSNIYLSTFHGLEKIPKIDVLIIDECHDLVDYVDLFGPELNCSIIHQLNAIPKQVFVSATPENLLISGIPDDFYYINIEKTSVEKPIINNLFWTSNVLDQLVKLIDKNCDRLIYLNDKDAGNDLAGILEQKGITCELVNSKIKGESLDMIISNSLLNTGTTYITTDIMNEGVNINNTRWDEIFIADTYNINPFKTYQLINRFRNANPKNINYLTAYIPVDDDGDLDWDALRKNYLEEYDYWSSYVNILNDKNAAHLGNNGIFRYDYIDKVNGTWVVVENKLKKDVFDKFYNKMVRKDQYFFKNWLNQYFIIENEKFIEHKIGGNSARISTIRDFFVQHWEYLLDFFKYSKDLGTIKDGFSRSFIGENMEIFKRAFERYMTLTLNYQLTDMELVKKQMFNRQDYYDSFIKTLNVKEVVSQDGNHSGSLTDQHIKENADLIKNWLDGHCFTNRLGNKLVNVEYFKTSYGDILSGSAVSPELDLKRMSLTGIVSKLGFRIVTTKINDKSVKAILIN